MVKRPSPMMMGVMGVSLAGVFTPPMFEPETAQLLFPEAGVLPETLHALRFLLQDVKGGDASGSDRRRMGSREQKGPGTVVEIVNEIARSAHIAAQRANGL